MPTPKDGESQDDFVSRCIPIVLEDGTAEDQKQAAAVCFNMFREARQKARFRCKCLECGHIVESDEHCADITCPECKGQMRREERPGVGRSRALPMLLTKVERLRDGRVRWKARANTGEFDLEGERFDTAFWDDVCNNFWRGQEALTRGEPIPKGLPIPILDISHYSVFLPAAKRNMARAGWPTKVWRDDKALMAMGFFDDSPLGRAAAKAASSRDVPERRVSICVYPDWDNVEDMDDGRRIFRGGRGAAYLDSLAMTAHPVDPNTMLEIGGTIMEKSLASDALAVLGDGAEELVAELEEAAKAKSEAVPEGVIIKAEDEGGDETEGEAVEEKEPQAEEDEPAEDDPAQNVEPETEPVVASEAARTEVTADILKSLIDGFGDAINQRLEPLETALQELAAKSETLLERMEALGATEGEKIKAALDGGGDWWTEAIKNSVQRRATPVKGETSKSEKASGQPDVFSAIFKQE